MSNEGTKKHYLPLVDVHPSRDPKIAYQDAREGRVPAFQLRPGGRWWVEETEWEQFLDSLKTGSDEMRPGPKPGVTP